MTKYTHAKLRFQAWNTLYQAWRKRYLAGAIAAVLASFGGPALAAPMGAEFLKGAGNVSAAGSATTVNITAADATRARASALINWKGGFNVGAAESVHFNNALPTAGKLSVYNVDNTGSVSVIDGTLTSSTGARATSVHLINPVGVSIGATANINVGGGFTAMAGSVATENCTTLPCVPVVYADGMQVEVSLNSGSINVSPAASIATGGSWDHTELNTVANAGTVSLTTPGGATTLPFAKYSGAASTDGVIDLQDAWRPGTVDGMGPLSWRASDTAMSSAKFWLAQGHDLAMDRVTVNGTVPITWGGVAGNLLLRDVQVTDTASRSAALGFFSYLANPDASARVENLVLDATHGFGATLNLANLLAPVDEVGATGVAGAVRPSLVLLDSQVRGSISAQGSMDVAVGTRPAGLSVQFDNAGFNRAADDRLDIGLGQDVNFKLSPDIGSADYTVANVDITGGKSVAIANINTPPSSGVGASTGLLRIDGLTVQGTGDMSIKSGTTGLVMANAVLSGSGALNIDTKGIEYSDISFGGSLNAENVQASFDAGIRLYAFENLDLAGGNLATATGAIALGNQYGTIKVADTTMASGTGNVSVTGSLGRVDMNRVSIATGGDVAISNHALAAGTVRQELALDCPTPDTCTFNGAGQGGQLHMTDGVTIAGNKVSIAGENVHLQGADILAGDDVSLSAANQLQVMDMRGLASTSQAPNASVTMAANVLLVNGAYSPVATDTAALDLQGRSVMRVDGLHFQSNSGDFIARTENSNIAMANTSAWTLGGNADVFTRNGRVTMNNVGLATMGAGSISVHAGQDIDMVSASMTGEATIGVTSTGGSIGMADVHVNVTAAAKYDPMDPSSVKSGIVLSAANGVIGMVGSTVVWDPTFYAQDANGNYLAQEGSGTVRIGAPLETSDSSGLFGDKALHLAGTHQDDGTHVNIWTGEASPIKTTAASAQNVVSIVGQGLNMLGSLVVAGKDLPAATPPVVTPPVVTPPVVVPPVVVPEPPVVVPPVVVPEPPVVVVPPVVVPEPPVVVVPPVVTPEPPVVVLPPVVPPAPPVAPPTTVPPVVIPVVVVSTRVEVANVAGPTMRADTVYVPGPGGQSRGVEVHSEPARVEVDEKDKR